MISIVSSLTFQRIATEPYNSVRHLIFHESSSFTPCGLLDKIASNGFSAYRYTFVDGTLLSRSHPA